MKKALLIIDYTESCCLERFERPAWGCTFSAVRNVAPKLERLLNGYRANSLGEVIWIVCCPWVKGSVHPNIERLYEANSDAEFYTDGTGASEFYRVSPLSDEQVFEKNMYSAFSGTAGHLHSYLSRQGVEHLLIAGIYSTGCVNATICEAFHMGYQLSIVGDCVETFDRPSSQDYQKILLQDWEYMYGEVISSRDVTRNL